MLVFLVELTILLRVTVTVSKQPSKSQTWVILYFLLFTPGSLWTQPKWNNAIWTACNPKRHLWSDFVFLKLVFDSWFLSKWTLDWLDHMENGRGLASWSVKASFLHSHLSWRMGIQTIILLFLTLVGHLYDSVLSSGIERSLKRVAAKTHSRENFKTSYASLTGTIS